MVVIPIMTVLFILSIINYLVDRQVFEKQIELTSIQLGDVLLGSLRYEMIHNDQNLMRSTLTDVISTRTISRAWIINLQGQIKISSDPAEEGSLDLAQIQSCQKCHKFPVENRPRIIQDSSSDSGEMRIVTPIQNDRQCWGCHPTGQKHLGILLIDAPLVEVEKNLQSNLQKNLLIATLISLILGLGVYFIINHLIVSPIEDLNSVIDGYSRGDFKTRVPVDNRRFDEIASLGLSFNQMADKLEQHQSQVAEYTRVREMAIVEERERIARELHDGIAQFLGYVIAKSQAASLYLKKENIGKALEYIVQLESEAQKQAIDVRASILGLKIFSSQPQSLAADIRKTLEQSNRFMDLVVTAEIDECLENLVVNPEIELQLLRIVQEAVSNIRKHAQFSKKALVKMEFIQPEGPAHNEGETIRITIYDEGNGFDIRSVGEKGQPHFGLSTMRERAEAIGAIFSLESTPSQGTKVSVTLKLLEHKA